MQDNSRPIVQYDDQFLPIMLNLSAAAAYGVCLTIKVSCEVIKYLRYTEAPQSDQILSIYMTRNCPVRDKFEETICLIHECD